MVKTFHVWRFLCSLLILGSCFLFGSVPVAHSEDATNSGAMDFPPMPKLAKPVLMLGPAGEHFNFVTCQKGDLVFTWADSTIPPGMGPMPHVHHYTNEWFYAAEGGIQLFSSDQDFESVDNPPDAGKGTQTTVYLIPLKAKHVVYGPKFHIHGFNNLDKVNRPLTFIWKPDPISPPYPYKDGGIREYFEAVAQKIPDLKHIPPISDKNRGLFVSEAPKYGINQSFFFLQYINHVETEIPATLNHQDNAGLNEILEAVKEYNAGSKEVTCR